MKSILFFLVPFFCWISAAAQKTEYIGSLGSGLFHYRYEYSTPEVKEPYYSMLNVNRNGPIGLNKAYANNPRGDKSGFSYYVSVGLKRVTRKNVLFGFNVDFSSRQSRKDLSLVFEPYISYSPAQGRTLLRNNMFGISPYLGKRIWNKVHTHYLDLTTGLGVLRSYGAHEQSEATITATGEQFKADLTDSYQTGYDNAIEFHWNVRVQYGFNQWGISAAYSLGLTKLGGNIYSGSYSRFLQAGLFFRLNKE